MVRQEERPWRAQTTVAARHPRRGPRPSAPDGLDAERRAAQASSLEWAISAAASIGIQALRAGRDVG